MKDLKIFISYSHEDEAIAGPLNNLLQLAFGPVLLEAFLDKTAISFGSDIKDSVLGALERADVLIAVLAGAEPASILSWPAFEIGTYSAFWDDKHYKQGAHQGREKTGVIGQVFALMNITETTDQGARDRNGPLQGRRPINLGISVERLSDGETEEKLKKARESASIENSELLTFLQQVEQHVKHEPEYIGFVRARDKTLPELVRAFKREAFDVLRGRVKERSKPTKQLIVRSKGAGTVLHDGSKLISIAGASEVFGKGEGDRLFKKTDEGVPGSERYETTWGEFKKSVTEHAYGPYWCGVIEQAAVGAVTSSELDPNLVVLSTKDQRYRIIATTITTYFNDDAEVSLYLIPALHRCDRGDEKTSNLLNLLILVCRFRFAFLESSSPFYWRNFANKPANPKEMLMELDFLNSEAAKANLEQPGVYEKFMTEDELSTMMTVWRDIDVALRTACNAAIARPANTPIPPNLVEDIAAQLKRIQTDVKVFNRLLGMETTKQLREIFEKE